MTVHPSPEALSSRDHPRTLVAATSFPDDAAAVIYRPARSVTTSGKARTREWKLRFERRTPPFIEPLMGWTGSEDSLSQVELSFPSAEAAVAYAHRQGLRYTIYDMPQHTPELRMIHSATKEHVEMARARRRRLEWVESNIGPEAIQQGVTERIDPAARYANPQDVLHDSKLGEQQKRELLHRWALDAYSLDLAYSNGSSGTQASRLQEVIDALIELDQHLADPESCAFKTAGALEAA